MKAELQNTITYLIRKNIGNVHTCKQWDIWACFVEHIKPICGATADKATNISSSMAHSLSRL
jgi:hypothetical protein